MELLGTVRRRAYRSRSSCTDSSARRSRTAAATAGTPRDRPATGTTFSIPTSVISTRGSVTHIRPLPSDSTTQIPPVSAIAKLAPLNPTLTRRNFSRRNCRAAPARSSGSRTQLPQPHGLLEQLANLGAVAVQRRNDDVGRAIVTELDDQVSEIRLERSDARLPRARTFRRVSSEVIVFTLITSRSPCAWMMRDDQRGWLRRRRGPSARGRRRRMQLLLELRAGTRSRWRSTCALIWRPDSRSACQSAGLTHDQRHACRGSRRWRDGRWRAAAGSRARVLAASGKSGASAAWPTWIIGRPSTRRWTARISARWTQRLPGASPRQQAVNLHQAGVVSRGADLRSGFDRPRAPCQRPSRSRRPRS